MTRLAVVSTHDHDHHDTGPRHPERAARLDAVEAGIAAAVTAGVDVTRVAPRPASHDELARAHDPRYVRALEQFVADGGGAIDADTVASPGSWTTACLAAGAGLVAIEVLRAGEADAAFVCARPPGHHATREHAMGFCLLNHVAIAAAALVDAGERVLVVDWDVHHGNGTEAITWDEPAITYVSTHQAPWYPGTGAPTDTGGTHAPGTVWNFGLPAGATGDVALAAVDTVAAAMAELAPTWVLVSCGFDAHRDDPLAELAWSAGDYALLARRVRELAPEPGRLALFLEGGYDLDALRHCTTVTLAALADVAPAQLASLGAYEPPTSGGPGLSSVARTSAAHAPFA